MNNPSPHRPQNDGAVSIVNLGCARNLVDAQVMTGRLKQCGRRMVDVGEADIVIVNTCGFIEDAKQESIDVIVELLELKKQGRLRKVIVAGCLAERYGNDLVREFKDIDAVVGVLPFLKDGVAPQEPLTPPHYAYVKICESCFNQCSFCAIPKIKGKFTSRTIESVVEEVRQLDERGVKEINIIGQDITAYGMDLYREKALARLLKAIVAACGNIRWIRLLYTFPAHITDELIDTIAHEEKICNYIDMPVQHISDHLLQAMNRNITKQQTLDLIAKVRERIPGACLRTSLIVGLPGETQEDFSELIAFIRQARFDKLGAFSYSREEGTPAHDMAGQLPDDVKQRRLETVMAVQQKISREIQKAVVGRAIPVIIDGPLEDEEDIYIGRSEHDAPEVDGVVSVRSKKALAPGDIVMVMITDATEYDLEGEAL